MKLMKIFFSFFLLLVILAGAVAFPPCLQASEGKILTLFLPDTDWPPYLTNAPGIQGDGVFVDVLKAVAEPMGYAVKIELLPDMRGWQLLDEGIVDVHVKAREWVSAPEKYYWTDSFMLNEDVLLYLNENQLHYSSPKELYGKRIAAIKGFVYPAFEPHFGPGKIIRVDVASPFIMLDLLDRGRVDAAMVNRAETQWLVRNKPELGLERFRMDMTPFDSAEYRYLFTMKEDWKPFVDAFNKELAVMKKDGRLKAILDQYR